MHYDLIVFDWDGTLMDSTPAIARSIIAASRDLGQPEPTLEMANHVIGLGLSEAMRIAVPDLPESQREALLLRYRHHYLAQDKTLALFEPIQALLDTLQEKAKMLAVATGKSRVGLNRLMERTGTTKKFMATRCADECRSKPHPQMLFELLDELGVMPENALMVGDTVHDIQLAQNAGMDVLAVGYGAHPREVLQAAKPTAYVDTPAEMAAWLVTA